MPTSAVTPAHSNERRIDQLAKAIQVDVTELHPWLSSIPSGFGYRIFTIPKRTSGLRYIAAPNKKLKELQRKIYLHLLRREPIQHVACGFVPRKSIVDNARPHLDSQFIIKIDLKDFFHSIPDGRVFNFWKKDNWSDDAAAILTRICCRNGSLPQGAPTSPALSNCVNQRFDALVLELAEKSYLQYTRYADDLTFSAKSRQKKAEGRIRPFLDKLRNLLDDEDYQVQWKKGVRILRKHQRQVVTGLVVNDRVRLPRPTRDLIRALRQKRQLGNLSERDLKRLNGYELLNSMVEGRPKKQDNQATAIGENASPPRFSWARNPTHVWGVIGVFLFVLGIVVTLYLYYNPYPQAIPSSGPVATPTPTSHIQSMPSPDTQPTTSVAASPVGRPAQVELTVASGESGRALDGKLVISVQGISFEKNVGNAYVHMVTGTVGTIGRAPMRFIRKEPGYATRRKIDGVGFEIRLTKASTWNATFLISAL